MTSGRFPRPEPEPTDSDDEVSRYWLRVGKKEIPLDGGETLVGRGEGCRIVVNEALASRRHARIVLDGGRPYIEDLGSANGTFVNQARLQGRAPLFPGDHVFIGTCEIEVVRRVDEDRMTLPVFDPEEPERHTPASGVGVFEPVARSQVPSSRKRSQSRVETARPAEETTEVDGLEYLGRLADKMFTMGRVDAALRILSGHLREILDSARSGKIPEGPMVDAAGRYAVKLANETLDGRWVDMAIEIHLLARRPLREETIQQLATLRAKAPLGDDALIARYYERLRAQVGALAPGDRMLCERVACLLPSLDAGR